MDARTEIASPRRETPLFNDDDDPTPIEEWTLDEVDSAFDLSVAHGPRGVDAVFD